MGRDRTMKGGHRIFGDLTVLLDARDSLQSLPGFRRSNGEPRLTNGQARLQTPRAY